MYVWLISDEVYSRLIYAPLTDGGRRAAPSLLDIATPDDRVIVCNSFSKTWAMTGWRLGWMVVPEGTRDAISEVVEVTHSGSPPFAQAGGVAAIADDDFVTRFRDHCAEGRTMALRRSGRAERHPSRPARRRLLRLHRRRRPDRQPRTSPSGS